MLLPAECRRRIVSETQAFRIAVRPDDNGMACAWLTKPDTMDGAVCIASVSIAVCEMDEAVLDHFKALCTLMAGVISIDAAGVAPTRIEVQQVDPMTGKPV